MGYIKISYDIGPDMPIFINNPKNEIGMVDSFDKGASWNSCSMTLFTHNGTHIDAPNHFDPRGKKICDYQLSDFIFKKPFLADIIKQAGEPIVASDLKSIVKEVVDSDLLLIRTGFYKKRGERIYIEDGPWLSPKAARFIRSHFKKLKAVGIDTISIASFSHLSLGGAAHQILLKDGDYESKPLMLIEDLNLGMAPAKFNKLYAIPLFVEGADSMPCTVFVE